VNNTHVGSSHRTTNQHIPRTNRVHSPRDYFGEALRILDNDMTLEPQREHLAALWGLAIGLTRRLTQALVESQDYRSAARRNNRGRPQGRSVVKRDEITGDR
jgi:hypothetical protein